MYRVKRGSSQQCRSVSEVAVMQSTSEKMVRSVGHVAAERCRWYYGHDQRRRRTGEGQG